MVEKVEEIIMMGVKEKKNAKILKSELVESLLP